MNCPACNAELKMTDRGGVEIDYCPQCRGVWLDRGELEKILERSMARGSYEVDDEYGERPRSRRREDDDRRREGYQGGYRKYDDDDDDDYGRSRHRRSFWRDLFDFD